jgi:anti-sigma factor RsiW
MNCPIDHDQLMAFAAGILDPCEIEAIESHLEFCMECRNVVEQNRMLLQSITKEPVLAPTALESLALSKALSELAPEVHYRTVNESPKAGFWGFAAASIAVFVAIVLGSMTHCFERIGAILLQSPPSSAPRPTTTPVTWSYLIAQAH